MKLDQLADCWSIIGSFLSSTHDVLSLLLVNSEIFNSVSNIDFWKYKIDKLLTISLVRQLNALEKLDAIRLATENQSKNKREILYIMMELIKSLLATELTKIVTYRCDESKHIFGTESTMEFIHQDNINILSEHLKSRISFNAFFSSSSLTIDNAIFHDQNALVEAIVYRDCVHFTPDAKYQVEPIDELSPYDNVDFRLYRTVKNEKEMKSKNNFILVPLHKDLLIENDLNCSAVSSPKVLVVMFERVKHETAMWSQSEIDLNFLITEEHLMEISKSIGALTFLEYFMDTLFYKKLADTFIYYKKYISKDKGCNIS